ncbi:shikimate dehydrogenase [Nocardioides sp. JQ2195]|uniref:shikimate dehydrogenase n=1 Tax=Nocardioides sp. JQ2195 TaxID=2592334 RepID=UPI00143E51F9|nr:shikimate dehydrogenase [Nocardioides sp. JQ2195]QIX26894.1 shikimate dehydrogenase [Nocardioides sp. JQ2195]
MPARQHCAVLGDPIGHSLSPTLHRAGYAALGLDWSYDAHQVGEVDLADFLDGLDDTWRGLSLTMPLKRRVLGLASSVSERARLAGAANTLVLRAGERAADNTDIPGAVAAIREKHGGALKSATILGGGATATSIGVALLELGVDRVELLVRSAARAEETLEVLRGHPSRPQVTIGALDEAPVQTDLVASTIPASAQSRSLVARCAGADVLFEALYDPWPTPLAASAGDRALVGGLDLLVHQAALQFEMFTEHPAPLDAMRAAGESVLAERAASAPPTS